MSTINWKIFLAVCVSGLLIAIAIITRGERKDEEISYTVFQSGNGWGYDILIKNRVYIHQPFIPVIPGEKTFPDKRSARKVAKRIIGKIKKGESPALTLEEIYPEEK